MTADLIILNARVLTMDKAAPRAEALAVKGNRIIAVSTRSAIEEYAGPATRRIDAQGKTVLPGFSENHLHIFSGGASLAKLSLADIKSFAALQSALRDWAARHPDETLISGIQATYAVSEVPLDRHALDRILADRPLSVHAADGHTVWANTLALDRAGILHGRDLPPGNEIVMGADGLATGELREHAAFGPVLSLRKRGGREGFGVRTGRDPLPTPTAEERAQDKATIRRGLDYCAARGITSIHNMDGNFYQLGILEELDDEGALPCRIQIPHHQKNDKTLDDLIRDAPAMRARGRRDRVTSNFVKIFVDGVLESTTALMLDDYTGHPGNRGLALFTQEEMDATVIAADRLGFQIAVHAIGDAGVRRTLDAFEAARKANGVRDSRHRIEHVEMIDPADIGRFRDLGVIASIQPLHAPGTLSYDGDALMALLGPVRQPYAFAWRTLREAGARQCLASDWPVSPVDPLRSICAAVTRKPALPGLPDQALTLEEAIAGYTRDGAYAEFAEDRKGRLKPGFLADIVVLDSDIEALAPEAIVGARPVMTICDGRITHEA